MSKKHFIELADVVRTLKPLIPYTEDAYSAYDAGRLQQWEFMRDELADFCQSQNSAFKRERWIAYINGECGKNGGKVEVAA